MLTPVINEVPVENYDDWKIRRITLRISPHVTDRILWEMSIWEEKGSDSRIIDILGTYNNLREDHLLEVTVALSPKDPHLANLEFGAGQSGFVEIITQGGTHGDLMLTLCIGIVGKQSANLSEVVGQNRLKFFLGLLERLSRWKVLSLDAIDLAEYQAHLLKEACVNARK